MKRLAVVFNTHAPYFRARLRAAGLLLPTTAVPLHDLDPAWKTAQTPSEPYQVRPLLPEEVPFSPGRIFKAVHQALGEIDPDVVAIQGWKRRCALAALAWCVRHRRPIVLMADFQAIKRSRRPLGDAIRQRLLRCCSAILTAGRPHAELLEEWGLPRERIRTGGAVVDNAHFTEGAAAARRTAASYRKRLELPHAYFLCVGRLAPEKNLVRLFQAYAEYRKQAGKRPWKLVVAGDGPLSTDLLVTANEMGLRDQILLAGTYDYRLLPAVYGLAQAFVLASTREPWGLAVNEAMASGLPVFVSDRCSCAPDLVRDGENGYRFDPLAPEGLAAHLSHASRGDYDLSVMGRASLGLISEWTPERFAQRLREAVEVAWSSPVKPSRWDASLAGILARRPGAPP